MIEKSHNGGVIILMSFVIAYMLMAIPLPDWAANWRPAWVAIVLIYWCLALPERVGVGIAWVAGMFLDVQQGTVFGQNAIVLIVIAFVILKLHKRIRVYPLAQQAMIICGLLLITQLLTLWIRAMMGFPPQHWTYWMPAFTSMLLWPWLFIILRDVRRTFRVY
ncbi:MAG: rod shape-determining protein MreD [Gammaproteobacteria bacterium]|nr:rod shape-determining protein MreD [Gammaproteobacteria bacterium]